MQRQTGGQAPVFERAKASHPRESGGTMQPGCEPDAVSMTSRNADQG
jgi:hypothetical protein